MYIPGRHGWSILNFDFFIIAYVEGELDIRFVLGIVWGTMQFQEKGLSAFVPFLHSSTCHANNFGETRMQFI